MRTAILLCSCLSFAACASATSGNEGTAPTISNLRFAPSSLPIGEQTTVTVNVVFNDPEGDLDQLGVEITLPDHSKHTPPMRDLQNVGTMTDGWITWALIITPPGPGICQLSVWITDVDGNTSNRLDASATAQ